MFGDNMIKEEYSFVIDTDSYSGNFERELSEHITGINWEEVEEDSFKYNTDYVGFCKRCISKGEIDGYKMTLSQINPPKGGGFLRRTLNLKLPPDGESIKHGYAGLEKKPIDKDVIKNGKTN